MRLMYLSEGWIMKKPLSLKASGVALTALIVCGLVFVGTLRFGMAETRISGIISSDTTWTKANSPYILTGPLGVAAGATLTIEPGVNVNLGVYGLQVGGALVARGTNSENIVFVSSVNSYGNIAFTEGAVNWTEETRAGSIIENAVLSSTSVSMNKVAPKISNNTITAAVNIDGSSPLFLYNVVVGDIGVHDSSPTIQGNSIIGGIVIGVGSPTIWNNTIKGGGAGNGVGIEFQGYAKEGYPYIYDNVIYDCQTGISARDAGGTIERNLLIDNDEGLSLRSQPFIVRNNTFAYNSIAIRLSYFVNYGRISAIAYNNIQNNSQNSIRLEETEYEVNASNNWWGTTDVQLIELSIHDHKNDFNLGNVSFTPFLTEPNPEAPAAEFTPIPLPTSVPSTTPTPTSTQSSAPTQTASSLPSQSQTPMPVPTVPTDENGQIAPYEILMVLNVVLIAVVVALIAVVVVALRRIGFTAPQKPKKM
jgi:hypothetical protein